MKRNMFEEIKAGIEELKNYPTVSDLRKKPEYRPVEIQQTRAFKPKHSLSPLSSEHFPDSEIFYYGDQLMNKL